MEGADPGGRGSGPWSSWPGPAGSRSGRSGGGPLSPRSVAVTRWRPRIAAPGVGSRPATRIPAAPPGPTSRRGCRAGLPGSGVGSRAGLAPARHRRGRWGIQVGRASSSPPMPKPAPFPGGCPGPCFSDTLQPIRSAIPLIGIPSGRCRPWIPAQPSNLRHLWGAGGRQLSAPTRGHWRPARLQRDRQAGLTLGPPTSAGRGLTTSMISLDSRNYKELNSSGDLPWRRAVPLR